MRSDEVSGFAEQGTLVERRLPGLGVSPGIAIGPAHLAEGGDIQAKEGQLYINQKNK